MFTGFTPNSICGRPNSLSTATKWKNSCAQNTQTAIPSHMIPGHIYTNKNTPTNTAAIIEQVGFRCVGLPHAQQIANVEVCLLESARCVLLLSHCMRQFKRILIPRFVLLEFHILGDENVFLLCLAY